LDRFSDGGPGRKILFQESIYKALYDRVVTTLTEAKATNAEQYSQLMDTYKAAM
jgi:hypothetical protein